MIERKGIREILKIIKKNNFMNCEFTFVGEGPMSKKIKYIQNRRGNIRYLNFKNQKNLNKIYMQNNILILPSKYDGWGVVIIEAMSRGMALISSDNVGASKEYLKHNFNGRIFNWKNKNLEKQIKFFVHNPKKIKIFGERNIKIFKSNLCNSINVVKKCNKILNKL